MSISRFYADGQLASSSGTLLGADRYTRVVSVSLFNTSSTLRQVIRLTLTGPTTEARSILRAKLEPYGSMTMRGVGMDPDTVLAGWSDDATTVDYMIEQTNSRNDESLSARPLSDKFQIQLRGTTGATLADELDPALS